MALDPYSKTVYVNDQAPAQDEVHLNNTEDGLYNVTEETILQNSRLEDLEAPVSTKYVPQATAPTYAEGQQYYDSVRGTAVIQGHFSEAPIRPGHTSHVHVINNSGAVIEKGMAVRHNGVDVDGKVQIEKAIATSFVNARVFGVAQHDITDTSEGAIMTFGEIVSVDTSGVTVGVPLYLSDTVAGTWTTTAPTIVSQIGGALTSASEGTLFVSIINNTSLPNIYGGLQGLTTPLYSLTTTAQDITGYTNTTEAVVTVNATTGVITLPYAGGYRANFTASISFTSSTSTRSVTFEVYDVTGTAIEFSYVKNIPRDATVDGVSFSIPETAVVNNQVKMRVKSSVAMDVTFDSIVFDIESVNIVI